MGETVHQHNVYAYNVPNVVLEHEKKEPVNDLIVDLGSAGRLGMGQVRRQGRGRGDSLKMSLYY